MEQLYRDEDKYRLLEHENARLRRELAEYKQGDTRAKEFERWREAEYRRLLHEHFSCKDACGSPLSAPWALFNILWGFVLATVVYFVYVHLRGR